MLLESDFDYYCHLGGNNNQHFSPIARNFINQITMFTPISQIHEQKETKNAKLTSGKQKLRSLGLSCTPNMG